MIDADSCDIDYLTILATEIDEYHPLSTADVNKVLDGYDRLFGDLNIHKMSLPLSQNMIQRLCGFIPAVSSVGDVHSSCNGWSVEESDLQYNN